MEYRTEEGAPAYERPHQNDLLTFNFVSYYRLGCECRICRLPSLITRMGEKGQMDWRWEVRNYIKNQELSGKVWLMDDHEKLYLYRFA